MSDIKATSIVTANCPEILKIAKILGIKIDDEDNGIKYCLGFSISVQADEAVKVSATFCLDQAQGEEIVEVLQERNYVLMEVQQGEPATMDPERSPSDNAPSH